MVLGSNTWDRVQFLVGQSIWFSERAHYARCRCTCDFPAVKFRDKKNKEGKKTLKMAVIKCSYFYESHCIEYPLGQASFFLNKRLPLLAEEVILHSQVAGKVVILSILAKSAGHLFECDV